MCENRMGARVLHLGIITIVTPLHNLLVTVLMIVGILVAINRAYSRESLISPSWDGVISGFGMVLGLVNLVEYMEIFA